MDEGQVLGRSRTNIVEIGGTHMNNPYITWHRRAYLTGAAVLTLIGAAYLNNQSANTQQLHRVSQPYTITGKVRGENYQSSAQSTHGFYTFSLIRPEQETPLDYTPPHVFRVNNELTSYYGATLDALIAPGDTVTLKLKNPRNRDITFEEVTSINGRVVLPY